MTTEKKPVAAKVVANSRGGLSIKLPWGQIIGNYATDQDAINIILQNGWTYEK